jgi:GcrA cell cycle regulator
MDWNDETIARLRAFWDEGHSTAEIGRRLGITKNAVVGKAHRLNLVARPSPIRRASVEEKLERGAPQPRRVVGPTLASVSEAQPPAPRASTPRVPDVARPQPVLRAVPPSPRPAVRVVSCCWPIGEPGTPSFRFCSDAAMAGKPYCADHAAIAYVKVRDRREDAA